MDIYIDVFPITMKILVRGKDAHIITGAEPSPLIDSHRQAVS